MINVYTLRYRTMRFQGKGDPAGFSYMTIATATSKDRILELCKKHDFHVLPADADYCDGIELHETTIPGTIETTGIEINNANVAEALKRVAAERKRQAEFEAAEHETDRLVKMGLFRRGALGLPMPVRQFPDLSRAYQKKVPWKK